MTNDDKYFQRILEQQAEHVNKHTTLVLVDDPEVAKYGNALFPDTLWTDMTPSQAEVIAKVIPSVVIHPGSESTVRAWKKARVGKVLNIIRSPLNLFVRKCKIMQVRTCTFPHQI